MDFSPQRAQRFTTCCIVPMLGVGLLTLLLVALETAHALPAQAAARAEFSCAEVTHVPQSECEALVDLYHATNGPEWTGVGSSWLVQQTDTPCNWVGVECEFGHVVQLALTDKTLTGTLPGDVFARLPELIDLSLGSNDLIGPIPPEIADLAYLKRLFLNDNRLSGEIPPSLLGHKAIPDISNYHDTLPILHLGDNDLTGTLPVDLGIPLAANAIRQVLVTNNPFLKGPIPVEYAGAIDLFGFGKTAICVPRDEAVSTWLNIPPSAWGRDPRMCPFDAAVHLRVEAGANVTVNGEVVSGTVAVDQDLRVVCDPLHQACAKVEMECTLGQYVVAAVVGTQSLLKGWPRLDDEDAILRMDQFNPAASIIMIILRMTPQQLAEACERIAEDLPPTRTVKQGVTNAVAADEISLGLVLEQGHMTVETPQVGIGAHVQTAHAVIELAALATGEVAVDPAVGTLLTMHAQTAIMTPTVGGAPREVAAQQGMVIFDDGLVYPFDVQLSFYIPLVVND